MPTVKTNIGNTLSRDMGNTFETFLVLFFLSDTLATTGYDHLLG